MEIKRFFVDDNMIKEICEAKRCNKTDNILDYWVGGEVHRLCEDCRSVLSKAVLGKDKNKHFKRTFEEFFG